MLLICPVKSLVKQPGSIQSQSSQPKTRARWIDLFNLALWPVSKRSLILASLAQRFGVSVGAGIGGLQTIEDTTALYTTRGHRRVSPFYIPGSIINMISGNLSIRFGLKGPNLAIATACSTGTHSIGQAARMIQYGDADAMLAGGAEAGVTPTAVAGFSMARALSRHNAVPSEARRPWDIGRDGFVIGEGAGVVLLEEFEHARQRNARIYAELAGFGLNADANHITQPLPNLLAMLTPMALLRR